MNDIKNKILVVCTTDSMIWCFLIPHIKFLQEKGCIVECACSRTGVYFDELVEKYHLVLHEIPFERSPFKWSNIKAYNKLSKLVHEGSFDLIHCHEPVGGAMGRLAGKRWRKNVMYFAHGLHYFTGAPKKHLVYYLFEWFLSFLTDSIITICEEDYGRVKKLHAKRCYKIHGIGVDFSRYDKSEEERSQLRLKWREKLGINNDDMTLISVGELSVRKNHKVIIDAIEKSKAKNHVHLIICGEGELLGELKLKTKNSNLESRVHFLGFRRDVPDVLTAADVMCFPSLWEGLGLAGIEAMYSGLPVIGSNRQGIKDYVKNNQTGFLFEPTDSDKLSEIIDYLYEHQDFYKNFVGRDFVRDYSLDKVVEELSMIYKKEKIYV